MKNFVKLAVVLLCGVVVLGPGAPSYGEGEFYVVGGGSPWKRNGSNIYYKDGNVGIGTDNPYFPLSIVASSASQYGVDVSQNSPGTAINAYNSDTTPNNPSIGVAGSVVNGDGVFGYHGSTTGSGTGVRGFTSSSYQYACGVQGQAQNSQGNPIGVWGIANGSGAGVKGNNASPSGYGVFGENTATTGTAIGVLGTTYTTSIGFAVRGESKATSGYGRGVYGLSYSVDGFGVQGENAGGGTAVLGSGNGCGVRGITYSTSGGIGVYGGCGYGGASYAVYGENTSTNGFAVYAHGNMGATGAKPAIVPTSQGQRLLYAQESPEVWFEDFGEGQLKGGKALIELDPLFLETVTVDDRHLLKVFIQLKDDCNGVYVRPQATSFEVKELRNGNSSASFTYRVVAKRKGFETAWLETAPEPTKVAALQDTKK